MRTKDEAKEQQILQAALGLIARVGLAGLKMGELAKEAGLAAGTLYVYFDDKEQLIRALYRQLLRKTTADLLTGVEHNAPVRMRIRQVCFNYLRELLEHPEYAAFFEQYFRSPYFHETDWERYEDANLMAPIYELVKEAQAQRQVKPLDPDLLVTLVCGALDNLAAQATYQQRLVDDDEWNAAWTVIWDGVKV